MSRRSARGAGGAPAAKRSVLRADLGSLLGRRSGDAPVEHEEFHPTLPQVDLLPRSVRDELLAARLRRAFALVLLLVVVIAGGVWYLQTDRIMAGEQAVSEATRTNEQVREELTALAPVRSMYEQITRLQGVVTTTLASQPQAAYVIEQLLAAGRQAAGDTISFSSIDVVYSGIPEAGEQLNPCPNPDPFTTSIAIGCVTFSASVSSREQVADLLRALEGNPLFLGPYVTTTTVSAVEGDADTVAFTGSAGIATDALATPLTAEEIEAILTPPAPTPAAEAGADATPPAQATGPAAADVPGGVTP